MMTDSTPTNCGKCTEIITGVAFLRCHGFCGNTFHVKCTTCTTQQHMRFVQEVPNLFWYCDECLKIMDTPQFRTAFLALSEAFRNLTEIHNTVLSDVKAGLEENSKKVEEIAAKMQAKPPAPPAWPNDQRPGVKRQRSGDSPDGPTIPKTSVGTKVMTSAVSVISKAPELTNTVWLWLSSFPPSVTEDDIGTMVRECLSCDAEEVIEVKMLVKKDVDISKLRSVTFKVGVDKKHHEASMSGDTWPEGVAFREFIDFDRQPSFDGSKSGFSKAARTDLAHFPVSTRVN